MKKYIFGPQVIKLNITDELVKELLEFGLKQTKPYNKLLAGKIENEFGFSKEAQYKFVDKIKPYIDLYMEELQKDKNNNIKLNYIFDDIWINIQKTKEYNPPHNHSGHLSYVIYLKIDKEIYNEKNNTTASPPGSITFQFGFPNKTLPLNNDIVETLNELISPIYTFNHLPLVGEMFIFPAYLTHQVEAFNTPDAERISIAGNITLKSINKMV
jgi:hypothetical protein